MKVIIKTKQDETMYIEYDDKSCEKLIEAINFSRNKDSEVNISYNNQNYTVKSNDIVSVEFIF